MMRDLAERAIKALERIADATEKISETLDDVAPERSIGLGGKTRVLSTIERKDLDFR